MGVPSTTGGGDNSTSANGNTVPSYLRVDLNAQRTKQVVAYPIALLSCVDHHARVCTASRDRAVGLVLGSRDADGVVHCRSSIAGTWHQDMSHATGHMIYASKNMVHQHSQEKHLPFVDVRPCRCDHTLTPTFPLSP